MDTFIQTIIYMYLNYSTPHTGILSVIVPKYGHLHVELCQKLIDALTHLLDKMFLNSLSLVHIIWPVMTEILFSTVSE